MLRRRHTHLLGACAAAALALAGCSSGSPAGTPPSSGPTTSAHASSPPAPTASDSAGTPPSPSTTAGRPGTVSLSFSDNGKAVRLKVGEHLHIALSGPYWTFHGSDAPRVLRQDSSGTVKPTTACSGPTRTAGCGTRAADLTAVGAGRTSVLATRAVCGEAMRCVGTNGRFVAYITVS